jgi:hypothetical protein
VLSVDRPQVTFVAKFVDVAGKRVGCERGALAATADANTDANVDHASRRRKCPAVAGKDPFWVTGIDEICPVKQRDQGEPDRGWDVTTHGKSPQRFGGAGEYQIARYLRVGTICSDNVATMQMDR